MIFTFKVLLRIFTFVQKRIENTFRLENDFKKMILKKILISVVSGGQTTVVTQLYNYEKMMFELNLTFTFCKVNKFLRSNSWKNKSDIGGNIDDGDGCCRPNVLVTSFRCW